MFGISFGELIVIGVVAVVIFGPEQLPSIAKKCGEFFAYFRNTRQKMSNQIHEQLGINEFNQLKDELTQTVDEIRQSITTTPSYEYSEKIDSNFEYNFFYQPELDFDSQPELFDE